MHVCGYYKDDKEVAIAIAIANDCLMIISKT